MVQSLERHYTARHLHKLSILKGVLTVWMALKQVSNFTLCIANLKKSDNLVVYRVGEEKYSVGVHFDERMRAVVRLS